ncbi:MAG: hypothetical protein QNJ44_09085 [Rhodobacter sp.]|nr:hypothetical protein [Rhodobacter sp.]
MARHDRNAINTCNARPPVRSPGLNSFNHDGLQIVRYRRRRFLDLPWRYMSLFLVLAMSLRMVTYSDLGPAGYAERAANLLDGNMAERTAGALMKLDRVSEQAAQRLRNAKRELSDLIL